MIQSCWTQKLSIFYLFSFQHWVLMNLYPTSEDNTDPISLTFDTFFFLYALKTRHVDETLAKTLIPQWSNLAEPRKHSLFLTFLHFKTKCVNKTLAKALRLQWPNIIDLREISLFHIFLHFKPKRVNETLAKVLGPQWPNLGDPRELSLLLTLLIFDKQAGHPRTS